MYCLKRILFVLVAVFFSILSFSKAQGDDAYADPLYKADPLIWLKVSSRSKEKMKYDKAVSYCDNLKESGYDWVLPSVSQLMGLAQLKVEWDNEFLWARSKMCLARIDPVNGAQVEICDNAVCPEGCQKTKFNLGSIIPGESFTSADDKDVCYVRCVRR